MEGVPNNPESFENFKNRIAEMYKTEGLSENLRGEIESWYTRRYQENEMRGVTVEQQALFQVELANIYLVTGRNNRAFNTLNDACDQAVPEREARIKELEKAINTPEDWINWRQKQDHPLTTDVQTEIEKIKSEIERLDILIPKITDLMNSIPEDPIED